jgi:hypothetical protein
VKRRRKAAEQANIRAENALGSLYEEGRGVRRDYAEALKAENAGFDPQRASPAYERAVLGTK